MTARGGEKLRPRCRDGAQCCAMIDPGHGQRRAEEALKLQHPGSALRRKQRGMDVAQPIEMKSHVLRLIGQDAGADLVENGIARSPQQHFVISRPDQLGDEQHLDLEVQSEPAACRAEEEVSPVALDQAPAETGD